MKNDISCPVDFIPVNENKVRLVAALVLLPAMVYLITGWWFVIAFLVIDFFLRSFRLNQYSLLGIIAGSIVKIANIKNKPTDQAPKRFAARIGLGFTVTILLFHFLQLNIIVIGLTVVLGAFAFLESVLSFCAGCYVYSYYYKLFGRSQSNVKAQ